LGARLFDARKRAGLTQADAATILDVARTTITAIESGERRVRPFELVKLSSAYGRPFSSFVHTRPTVQTVAPQFRASFKNRPDWEDDLAPVFNDLEEMLNDYMQLYHYLGVQPSHRYTPEYVVAGLSISEAAETIAVSERNRLGLGDGPVTNLRDVLEHEVGISVFNLALPGWCSGIYLYSPELGAIIVINSVHPAERQRLTLAHEFLHFLASRNVAEVSGGSVSRMSFEERVAGEFPNHFLMPTAGLRRRIAQLKQETGGLSTRSLLDVAAYYGVSVEALLKWLEELRLLPTGTFEKAKQLGFPIRQIQSETGIVLPKERTDMLPLAFQRLAFKCMQDERFTEGRFAELLRMDRVEARRLAHILRDENSSNESSDQAIVA
jgi:Zn-dependent peptidase ImmA (M78 family)/transcriptional regulator with XRE-family HTH domain